jgi:hypothetical protein
MVLLYSIQLLTDYEVCIQQQAQTHRHTNTPISRYSDSHMSALPPSLPPAVPARPDETIQEMAPSDETRPDQTIQTQTQTQTRRTIQIQTQTKTKTRRSDKRTGHRARAKARGGNPQGSADACITEILAACLL